MEHTSLDLTVI